jgi:hypothetical protein
MKVFHEAFMCLQLGFVIFWQKDFSARAADPFQANKNKALKSYHDTIEI